MINSLSKYVKSASTKILLFILAGSFALWGVGDIFSGGQNPTIAKIGPKEIKVSEFLFEYQNTVNNLKRQNPDLVDEELLKAIGMQGNVLNSMINTAYIDIYTNNAQLGTNRNYVKKSISRNPQFIDQMGIFNKDMFKYFLKTYGLTEEIYIEKINSLLKREQLIKTIVASTITPNILSKAVVSNKDTLRKVEIVMFNGLDFPKIEGPTNKELKSRYELDKENLLSSEARDFTITILNSEKYIDDISITQETLKEIYQDRIENFTSPQTRKVSQVIVSKESTAFKIIEEIKNGASFTSAAMANSSYSEEDLNLGYIKKGDLEKSYETEIFSSPINTISKPIKTPFGWRIFIVLDTKDEIVVPFKDAQVILSNDIKLEKSLDIIYEKSNNLFDLLSAGNDFKEASKEVAGKVLEFKNINLENLEKKINKQIPNIMDFTTLSKNVFNLEKEEFSDIIDSEEKLLYILKIDDIIEPRLQTFIELKDYLSSEIIKEKKISNMTNKAKAYGAFIRDKDRFVEFDKIKTSKIIYSDWITRDSRISAKDIPQSLIKVIFDTPLHSLSEITPFGEMSLALVRPIDEKQINIKNKLASNIDETANNIKIQISEDIINAIIQDLKKQNTTKINQNILDSL